MSVKHINDLTCLPNSDLKLVSGGLNNPIHFVSTPEKIKSGSLVFVSTKDQWNLVLKQKASLVISLEDVVPTSLPTDLCVLTTKNIKRTMATVLSLFDYSRSKFSPGIHPTAVVSPDCTIGKNVHLGAHVFIGKGVKIDDGVRIGPNSVIEDFASIGHSTVIHAQVFIGYNCLVGHHCEIHAHTSIGSDGFGFYTDSQYSHFKVPQTGNVVIGDQVEIGSSCCIDRATIDSTVIGSGSKIDNLCHIAHNCTVGENSLIAAGFFVAGSSHLGKRFTTGGSSVVSTQIHITDGVTLAGRSAVTKDILESGQYGGYPLQPLKEFLKTVSTIGTIVEMRKKLNLVLKTLSIKE